VVRLGFLPDRDVWVGLFPEGEEIFSERRCDNEDVENPVATIDCLVLLLASRGEEIQSAVDSSPPGTTVIQ
jgi:hypothetical protein